MLNNTFKFCIGVHNTLLGLLFGVNVIRRESLGKKRKKSKGKTEIS